MMVSSSSINSPMDQFISNLIIKELVVVVGFLIFKKGWGGLIHTQHDNGQLH
jgi:hypothetical protein